MYLYSVYLSVGECLCLYGGLYSLVNDDLLCGDLVLLCGDLGELRDLLCV